MKRKKRILEALVCKQPDKVPIFEMLIDEISVLRLYKIIFPDGTKIEAKKTRWGEESRKVLECYFSVVKYLDLDAIASNFSVGLEILDNTCNCNAGSIFARNINLLFL